MKVIVRFFATYREVVGEKRIEMEIGEKATLGELLAHIYERYPKLEKWSKTIVPSVNRKYAKDSTALREGDEVALLPPVSGGARITSEDLRIEQMLTSLKSKKAGAVVLFVGIVREDPGVRRLTVECYPEMATEILNEIVRTAEERFEIERMDIIHRTGTLGIGENIVVVGVSAPHRKDAFRACEWGIEEVKKLVPIWKKDQG
ncbi:MAG: MoaD family protein [Thermoplasmata archaeon]